MAMRSKINRGNEIRTKGKSMGRERSGAAQPSSRPAPRAALFMAGRVALMLAGIAVMALGIDLVVKGNLGNSPISACPYVMSHVLPDISFGTLMLVWQCLLVATQIAILRRDFRPIDLLQLPVSVFFGLCIDVFVVLLAPLSVPSYLSAWLYLVVGILVLAAGIVMTVVSGTVMNCGEAVVQAVVAKTGIRFGTVKVSFDLTCAIVATVLGLAFLGYVEGVREGTVVCAVFTGMVVNLYMAGYGKLRAARAARLERRAVVGGASAPCEDVREAAGAWGDGAVLD